MTVVHRADHLPAGERADYWRHVIGDTLVPLDPVGDPDEVRAGEIGALQVAEISAAAPGGARRTPAHIRRADPGLYKIDVLAAGSGVIVQGGREAALGPGDFTLVDLSRPASWALDPARTVALTFPPSLFPLRRDEVDRLTAMRIRGDRGPGALASSLARQLAGQLDHCGVTAGARLGTAVVDLVAAGLAARLGRSDTLPEGTARRAVLVRIKAFIESRLADPELTPTTVAAAHFISVRHLHKLFEGEQATVADWIRRRRLERCRRDLLDPSLRAEPVGSIGMRSGFPDPAHFSRVFRRAYGMPPAEYRDSIARGFHGAGQDGEEVELTDGAHRPRAAP